MSIKREVSITPPFTLADLEEFIAAAKAMGVQGGASRLEVKVKRGWDNQRDGHQPDEVTITAKA